MTIEFEQRSRRQHTSLSLVYRASFRQTFEEFTAPTGLWKWAFGWTLISLAGLVLAYDGWRHICQFVANEYQRSERENLSF